MYKYEVKVWAAAVEGAVDDRIAAVAQLAPLPAMIGCCQQTGGQVACLQEAEHGSRRSW
jgi:hypothetical protein